MFAFNRLGRTGRHSLILNSPTTACYASRVQKSSSYTSKNNILFILSIK